MFKQILIFLIIFFGIESVFAIEDDYSIVDTDSKPVLTANKTEGTLTVYWPDTGKKIVEPALFGKVKSNVLDWDVYNIPGKRNNYITPSGTFPIKKMISWRLNENMLVYIEGKEAIAAIHPLWNANPDQNRLQRLSSVTPLDNRITGGCINVDSTFYYSVLDHLPDGTILTILPE